VEIPNREVEECALAAYFVVQLVLNPYFFLNENNI